MIWTSSPAFLQVIPGSPLECPPKPLATKDRGCAWLRTQPNISRHELTTTMHHRHRCSEEKVHWHTAPSSGCQDLGFFALLRIKPHAHRLCAFPSIFEFHSANAISGGILIAFAAHQMNTALTPSVSPIVYGVISPGYLIPFAPTLSSPAPLSSSKPPSPLVFLLISTHLPHTRNPNYPPTL